MKHQGSITPAYGRDYTDEEAAVRDWNDGKDFVYHNITSPYDDRYCSVRDFTINDSLQLRFNRMSEVIMVSGAKS